MPTPPTIAPRVLGFSGDVVPQPMDFSWDRRTGFKNGQAYKGLVADAITAANMLALNGVSYRFKGLAGGFAEVSLDGQSQDSTGSASPPIHSYQLLDNTTGKSIWQHPNTMALISAAAATTTSGVPNDLVGKLKAMLNSLANATAGSPYNAATTISGTGSVYDLTLCQNWVGGSNGVAVAQLWQLLSQDQDQYDSNQYVLEHKQTVPDGYTADLVDTNPQVLYTTAQMLSEITGYDANFPTRLQDKINAIPAPAAQYGYLWSWRKEPSTECTVANSRIEVTARYVLDQWSTYNYIVHP